MIAIGMMACPACAGSGYAWPPPPAIAWQRCKPCDGIGQVWRAGGPAFGCTLTLADRQPGDVVELATGDRGRILWHMPRKDPEITFIGLIDPFDETESDSSTPVDSRLGVVSVAALATGSVTADRNDHHGEKDSDAVDPFARRAREHGGPLL